MNYEIIHDDRDKRWCFYFMGAEIFAISDPTVEYYQTMTPEYTEQEVAYQLTRCFIADAILQNRNPMASKALLLFLFK